VYFAASPANKNKFLTLTVVTPKRLGTISWLNWSDGFCNERRQFVPPPPFSFVNKLIDIRISLQLGLFANPIYSSEGDYPDLVRKQVDKLSEAEGYYRSRLRKFTSEEIRNIKGKHNHVHVQIRQEVQFSGCLTFTWRCSL
jgi:hypothetical protein